MYILQTTENMYQFLQSEKAVYTLHNGLKQLYQFCMVNKNTYLVSVVDRFSKIKSCARFKLQFIDTIHDKYLVLFSLILKNIYPRYPKLIFLIMGYVMKVQSQITLHLMFYNISYIFFIMLS